MNTKGIAEEVFIYAYTICQKEGRAGGVGDHIWVNLCLSKCQSLVIEHCLDAIKANIPELGPDATEWDRGYDKAMHDCLHHITEHFDESNLPYDEQSLVHRLRKRAEIRRQIKDRKSVQEGKPDRISDLLEEAAVEIERLRALNRNI